MKQPKFIIELLRRFLSDNPPFFKKVQLFSGIIAAITELPDLLELLSINVPTWLYAVENKFVTLGALITIVLAQTPNVDKTIVQTRDSEGEGGISDPNKPKPPITPNP